MFILSCCIDLIGLIDGGYMVVGGGGFGLLVDGRDHTCALDVFWILDLAP